MPTRRDFLKVTCGLSVLALGSAVLAEDAVAADGIVRKPNGQVVVTVSSFPALAKAGGVLNLGIVRGTPVAVVSLGGNAYRAISLSCTHQGTTVQQSGSIWRCPSHGSQFTADGTFISGPAGRSLNTVASTLRGRKLTVG